MSVKCVVARGDDGQDIMTHTEHRFVAVPRSGDNVSLMIGGRPEVFRVSSVMHCEAGLFGDGSEPIVNISVSQARRE